MNPHPTGVGPRRDLQLRARDPDGRLAPASEHCPRADGLGDRRAAVFHDAIRGGRVTPRAR